MKTICLGDYHWKMLQAYPSAFARWYNNMNEEHPVDYPLWREPDDWDRTFIAWIQNGRPTGGWWDAKP